MTIGKFTTVMSCSSIATLVDLWILRSRLFVANVMIVEAKELHIYVALG